MVQDDASENGDRSAAWDEYRHLVLYRLGDHSTRLREVERVQVVHSSSIAAQDVRNALISAASGALFAALVAYLVK